MPGMAALTVCLTGLRSAISGEGTNEMPKAFQYAGAKSVSMGWWLISEQASEEFVERFFRNLKVGKSKLESLKLARDEIRKDGYEYPFIWVHSLLRAKSVDVVEIAVEYERIARYSVSARW